MHDLLQIAFDWSDFHLHRSTLRRIQHGRSTPGEGCQAGFAASLANSGLAPLTVRAVAT